MFPKAIRHTTGRIYLRAVVSKAIFDLNAPDDRLTEVPRSKLVCERHCERVAAAQAALQLGKVSNYAPNIAVAVGCRRLGLFESNLVI